ncbi:MAG: hypothetical protein MJ221_01290 [Bacilli bacterium]|nr:hypothetical protein [Bacilli bacterium]
MKELNIESFEDIITPESNMKSLISKLVNDLREDIEVYEKIKALNVTVGEVRENIAKLTDFKEDYNYCKNCPGIDKCSKSTPHISMHLKKEGDYISASYEPCPRMIEQIAVNRKYLCADFPSEWKSSTLRTLDLTETRKLAIKEFAKIIKGQSERWIYVTGNHKTGKSFMLVTFANEFASQGKGQVAVVNSTKLIQSLADLSYKDKEEFTRQMVALSNVPLLVFDDFGEEYKNEYIRDQIVLPILTEREHNSKLTFFTSEFTISEIKKLYSVGVASGEIRGRQLEKILTTMCGKEFDLTGASIYRK